MKVQDEGKVVICLFGRVPVTVRLEPGCSFRKTGTPGKEVLDCRVHVLKGCFQGEFVWPSEKRVFFLQFWKIFFFKGFNSERASFPGTGGSVLPDSGCGQIEHSRSAGSGSVPVPGSGAGADPAHNWVPVCRTVSGFILLSDDIVGPSVEPESPILELFCYDCHAVPLERFLTFNMSFFRRNGWFL